MSVAAGAGVARRSTKNRAQSLLAAAVATFVVPLAGLAGMPVGAQAQQGDPIIAQATLHDFDIAAQPLASGLITFARVTGLQVSAETGLIGAMRTPGVHGRLTAD